MVLFKRSGGIVAVHTLAEAYVTVVSEDHHRVEDILTHLDEMSGAFISHLKECSGCRDIFLEGAQRAVRLDRHLEEHLENIVRTTMRDFPDGGDPLWNQNYLDLIKLIVPQALEKESEDERS